MSSSKKTERITLRVTPEQKDTWDSRTDSADKVRDLLSDLEVDADGPGGMEGPPVEVFVNLISDMDNRWGVPRDGDASAVRAAREAGLDLPGGGERAARELYSAVKASEVPEKDSFEVSDALVSSLRSALD